MFSIEYFNNDFIITSYNLQEIDTGNVGKLRKLILQVMKRPCKRILVNLNEVNYIDLKSLHILKITFEIAKSLGISVLFMDLTKECQQIIKKAEYHQVFQILPKKEVLRLLNSQE